MSNNNDKKQPQLPQALDADEEFDQPANDDTSAQRNAYKEIEFVECAPLLEKLQNCYKYNNGMYGCEEIFEKMEACRTKELEKAEKERNNKEWMDFKKQYVLEKKRKLAAVAAQQTKQ